MPYGSLAVVLMFGIVFLRKFRSPKVWCEFTFELKAPCEKPSICCSHLALCELVPKPRIALVLHREQMRRTDAIVLGERFEYSHDVGNYGLASRSPDSLNVERQDAAVQQEGFLDIAVNAMLQSLSKALS